MKNVLRLFMILCMALASATVFAQEPTGSIEGTVKDTQGAVVPNSSVTVRNAATNFSRTATTGDNGHYRISQLPPGTYEVKVAGTSFKTSVMSDVVVAVGQTLPLDVSLEVGGASETVTVVGGGDLQIDRTDNAVAGVVNTRQIASLPLNGRNFLDLAQLQPGVESVAGGGFDPTKANYTGISIAGQAGRSAQIAVDGSSVVDNVVGTTTQNFSQEIVQEFQLGISNVDVSTGASGTGSVNIVSKSGSNEFHGNAFIYNRDSSYAAFPGLSRLDAANGIPAIARAEEVPFDRQQFGGTIGGPIAKDKLFFFTSYEYNNQDAVALQNTPQAPSFSGFTPNPFNETLFTGKIDWIVNSSTTFFGRYSFNDNDQQVPFAPNTGSVPRDVPSGIFQSNDQLVLNKTHGFVLGLTKSFSPKLTNSFIYGFNDFDNGIAPATEGFPEIRLLPGQIFRTGTNAIAPQTTLQHRNQLRNDLTYATGGNHTLRFGGNYERSSVTGQFAFAKPGRIRLHGPGTAGVPQATFETEADFLNAFVRDISLGVGNDILPFNTPGGKTINHRIQVYGNDNWKIRPNFTLNYGLAYRYDSNLWNHDQPRPAVIAPLFGRGTQPSPSDKNNFAPRVGFAYDIGGNGKTVIRGGFGMYYDTTIDNLRLFERADLGPPGAELFLVSTDIQSSLLPGGDGRFPVGQITLRDMLALLPAVRRDVESRAFNCTLPTSIECFEAISGPLFSTEFQIPYSLQYSIGVQRELPGKMLLQADFNYRKGVHEVITYDINQHDNVVTGPRLSPSVFDNAVPYADSSGFSTYKALLLRLDRRFDRGFQLTASYSSARFKAFGGDTLGLGATATDLNNLRAEFGPSGLDRTHRFVVSGVYELPFFRNSDNAFKRNVLGGYQVSLISTAFSGLPFSAFLPGFADLSGTGTFQSYLPGTGPGSIGRDIKSVSALNALITTYNNTLAGTDDPQGTTLSRLALLPEGTQLGSDSVISQDVRVTKTFSFTESVKLDLIGEVFNLFNVANLSNINTQTLAVEGSSARNLPFRPTTRTSSVFGTGGPRAFQFAAKFRF
ncbi:MAG: TonB-dependent receptor [Pyrinomonadaceae bacterium]|nr:TonB-dependent receptor [Pyrinomonadaceae bacterium]